MKKMPDTTRVEFVYTDSKAMESKRWGFSTLVPTVIQKILLVNVATEKIQFEVKLIPDKLSFGGVKVEVLRTQSRNARMLAFMKIFSRKEKIPVSQINYE